MNATVPVDAEAHQPESALRMTDILKVFPGVRACDGANLEVAAGPMEKGMITIFRCDIVGT